MYNRDITKRRLEMTSIEKASAKVNELVNGGMELDEAIRKASVEFGVPEETLLIEWDF